MDMCKKEGLHQVDLLTPAERKSQEKNTGHNAGDRKSSIS